MTRKSRRLSVCPAVLLSAFFVGCAASDTDDPQDSPKGDTLLAIENGTDAPKNTFITDWLEIDDIDDGSGDANLFAGTDPANPDKPTGGTDPYIDWNELVTASSTAMDNHRELDDMGKKDASAFPQSDSCVGASTILDKMNLTYAAIANNSAYVYLAVQRAKKTGDAAYYWLFTKVAPSYEPSTSKSCASGEDLVYTISGPTSGGAMGDVLVRGLFRPSADEPALEVFQATADATVPAEVVINIEYDVGGSPLWAEFTGPDPTVVAVNTSSTEAGAMGYEGVVSHIGTLLEEHIFAEGAVPLSAFTGGSSCGKTYHASVLSRPSHSPTSDPKDLIGPFPVNFGSTEATATLTPACSTLVGYSASGKGATGDTIPPEFMTCSWSFGSTECSGDTTFPIGLDQTATVTVTDTRNQCADDAVSNAVDIYEDIDIDAQTQDACTGSGFGVCATVTGGDGDNTFTWTVSGPGTATLPADPSACPTFDDASVTVPGPYSGTVRVTDSRGCYADDELAAKAYAPLSATLTATANACTDDLATFTLGNVSGGNSEYVYDWSKDVCDEGPTAATSSSCGVNPDDALMCTDDTISVSVSDTTGICASVPKSGTYGKQTTVTLTCGGGSC